MEPQKRNKELHLGSILIPVNTILQDLMTGELYTHPKDSYHSGWYCVEKLQWFYWTVFYTTSDNKDVLVKVRRDKVHLKSGTHRLVHRDVIQKRMSKILKAASFEHMRLPVPPTLKKNEVRYEVCPDEWKALYQSYHNLAKDHHVSRPWSEIRRSKMDERIQIKKEDQLKIEEEKKIPFISEEELKELDLESFD